MKRPHLCTCTGYRYMRIFHAWIYPLIKNVFSMVPSVILLRSPCAYILKRYRKIPKISPGAYIFQRPFLMGLILEGLIFGGKIAFQNRLGLCVSKSVGLAHSWKEIYFSNLQNGFTESRLEDVDFSKTQQCKYFVYMDRGNPNQNEEWTTQTAVYCVFDCNHLAHVIVLWQIQKLCYCTVIGLFSLYLRAISKYKPRGIIFGGAIWRRDFALRVWGLIFGGAYFRNFTVILFTLAE